MSDQDIKQEKSKKKKSKSKAKVRKEDAIKPDCGESDASSKLDDYDDDWEEEHSSTSIIPKRELCSPWSDMSIESPTNHASHKNGSVPIHESTSDISHVTGMHSHTLLPPISVTNLVNLPRSNSKKIQASEKSHSERLLGDICNCINKSKGNPMYF